LGSFTWKAEGQGNPSVAAITSDLQYIHDKYASSPAYLKMGGRFVVFVYADPGDQLRYGRRWTQANTLKAYLVLKIFTVIRKCPNQPDAWHELCPGRAEKGVGNDSFTISPGFYKASEPQHAWRATCSNGMQKIQAMLASQSEFLS